MFEREPKLRSRQHAEDDLDAARERERERRPGKQSRLDAKPERPKHPGKRTREGEMHPGDAIAYAAAISDPAARTGSGYGTMGSAFGFVADPRYARIDRRAEPNRRDIDQAGLCGVFDLLEEIRGGERLPRELEERFAAELGLDPQRIRVHVGADAARVASELGARAVAIGDDIYFADGAYDPASPAGIELIAHEVAHVAQHQRGNEIAAPQLSRPEDAHEQEADRFATSFIPFAPPIDGARGEGTPGTGQQAAPNANAGAAGSVTHQTQQSAPGGGGDDRTKVGVGEKVDFTSDDDGAWTASNAHGPKTKSGKTYTWIAPVTADTVTITFTPKGGTAQPTTMTVIPPSDVQFDKTSDLTNFKSGTAGVGMVTNITFLPLDVSFAFVSWLEIPGGPSGQTGYFSKHTAPSHHPNPNPLHLGSNNAGPNDTASFFGVGKPWTDGFFEWVIPNHYVVDGESKPGHKFTDIHQTAKLDGDPNAGRMTVTKGTAGGATAVRSPDGTLAMADPAAPSPDPNAAEPSARPPTAIGLSVGEGARGDGGDQPSDGGDAIAPTITHTTDQTAPGGVGDDRTTVGVGEKVAFTSDVDGSWSSSASRGPRTAKGNTYSWLAPVLPNPSVTITFTPKGGRAIPTTMTVIAPADVEFTKTSDITDFDSGTAGVGMWTNVRFLPLDVSFAFTSWHEIPGGPSGQKDYFTSHRAPAHHPNPDPRPIGADNGGPQDQATFAGFPSPWKDGFFEWVIPTHYVVEGESKPGHKITDIHQTATLEGDPNAGRLTVTKGVAGGATSTRSPDGTVASNAAPGTPNPTSATVGFGVGNPDPNAAPVKAAPGTAVAPASNRGSAHTLLQKLDLLKVGTDITAGVLSLDALHARIREVISDADPGGVATILVPAISGVISKENEGSIDELKHLETETIEHARVFKALEQEWQQIEYTAGELAKATNDAAANAGALVPRVEVLKLKLSKAGGIGYLQGFIAYATKHVGEIGERTGIAAAEYSKFEGSSLLGKSEITDALDVDMARFDLGAVVGIGEGAYEATKDTLTAVTGPAEQILQFQFAICRDGLAAFSDAATSILDALRNLKELPGALGKRWKASDDYDKGELCGQVAGYLGALVAIAALTDGMSVAAELGVLSGELADLVKVVMKLTNPLEHLSSLAETAERLPQKLRRLCSRAARGGEELGVARRASGIPAEGETVFSNEGETALRDSTKQGESQRKVDVKPKVGDGDAKPTDELDAKAGDPHEKATINPGDGRPTEGADNANKEGDSKPSLDPAAEARQQRIDTSLAKELMERKLDGESMLKAMDPQTRGKVNTALSQDPLAKAGSGVQDAVVQWAKDGASGNPREFANRYEYARAMYRDARDSEASSFAGKPNAKRAINEAAGKRVSPEKLTEALNRDNAAAETLGPGRDIDLAKLPKDPTPEDIAGATQKLERVTYESPTAESYHAVKHQAELPEPRLAEGRVENANAYAMDTIQTGKVVDASLQPNGSIKVIVHKTYPNLESPMEAIIYVKPTGKATLASYGQAKAFTGR